MMQVPAHQKNLRNEPVCLAKILKQHNAPDKTNKAKDRRINPNERDEEICNFEGNDGADVREVNESRDLFKQVFRDSQRVEILDDREDEQMNSSIMYSEIQKESEEEEELDEYWDQDDDEYEEDEEVLNTQQTAVFS